MPKETTTKVFSAVGRRKTATARARLVSGKGEVTVNKLPVEKYFSDPFSRAQIAELFRTTNTANKFSVTIVVAGSGKSGQAGAAVLAVARALCQFNPEFKTLLRKKGFITRDPRARQREKAGLMGARKQKQSPKR